jgi:hypothetical protein
MYILRSKNVSYYKHTVLYNIYYVNSDLDSVGSVNLGPDLCRRLDVLIKVGNKMFNLFLVNKVIL